MAIIHYDVRNIRDPHDPEAPQRSRGRVKRKKVDLPSELEAFRLFSVDELDELPPLEWLVPGYIANDELHGLWGEGGSLKSFLAIGWACELAAAGHDVVYVMSEGRRGIRLRTHAWSRAHGREKPPRGLHILPGSLRMHDLSSVKQLSRAIALQLGSRKPALVVVDTLARNFVGGNENDARDMGLFVEGCEQLRRDFEAAVLVIHHSTKKGDTERGTEALRNASFAMFKLERAPGALTVTLKCDRMKEAQEPEPLRVPFRHVQLPDFGGGGDHAASLALDWPDVAVVPPEEDRVLTAVIAALREASDEGLGADALRQKVQVSVRLGAQEKWRAQLRRWAEDPTVPVFKAEGKRGGYVYVNPAE